MINKNFTDRPWQDIQAETLEYIFRVINMIQIYDKEKKFPFLHDAVEDFQKKFAKGTMRVYDMGYHAGYLSQMLSSCMHNNSIMRVLLAENANQPSITEGMKKYLARNCFGHVWEFYFKTDENAQTAFNNLSEENFRLIDDIGTQCDELPIPCNWWADGEPESNWSEG